jgi:hypothetical protein
LLPVDPRILAGAEAMAKEATRSMGGNLAWPGLLRRLDRRNPGYRE